MVIDSGGSRIYKRGRHIHFATGEKKLVIDDVRFIVHAAMTCAHACTTERGGTCPLCPPLNPLLIDIIGSPNSYH